MRCLPAAPWYGAEPLGRRMDATGSPAAAPNSAALADALAQQSLNSAPVARHTRQHRQAPQWSPRRRHRPAGRPARRPALLPAQGRHRHRPRQAGHRATGVEHVPIFWLATEDHDLEEVDQVSLLTKTAVETLRLGLKCSHDAPVGSVVLGSAIDALLDRPANCSAYAPICDLLRECYGSASSPPSPPPLPA